jgi:hypothetical protein
MSCQSLHIYIYRAKANPSNMELMYVLLLVFIPFAVERNALSPCDENGPSSSTFRFRAGKYRSEGA